MWRLYHDLLALRRAHPALSVGDWLPVECAGNLLAHERRHESERLLIVLNLGDTPEAFAIPEWAEGLQVLLTTGTGSDPAILGPNEGYILG